MGRSKFNRKNSTGSVHALNSYQRKNSASSALSQGLIGSQSPQDTLEAIDYHFGHLNTNLKAFLLSDPGTLDLKKFINFWIRQDNIDSTSPSVAASICGCSWYLGLSYLSIGMLAEARALTLNGCFMQQCYNTPIEKIAAVCVESASSGTVTLPFFNDGLIAISTQQRLASFLKNKVTEDYQRRMAFSTRTKKTQSQVKDYIDQIGSDWNETPKAKQFRKRASTGMNVDGDEKFIDILLVDARSKKETTMRHGTSMPLKLLVKKFAEEQCLPLKNLRFSYYGKNLFLSSLGQKSSRDLGISHLDSIFVYIKDDDEATSSSSSDECSSKENHPPTYVSSSPCIKKIKTYSRKNSHTPCTYMLQEEQDRRNHSRKLSRLFEEAEPKFKVIRQKLTVAARRSCHSAEGTSRTQNMPLLIKPVDNPCTVGQGGKAGVPFYVVHVGATDNLYKTRHTSSGRNHPHSIDLHGYTREKALEELDAKLPEWVNIAHQGQYPFVIAVTIVCGCGNQILSEAVDDWIKSNDFVANAPKKKFNRMQSY